MQVRRVEYEAEMADELVGRLKFLDEAGSNLAMTRLYGRASRGERVYDSVPQNYGENVTILATLSLSGIEAPMMIEGAVDGIGISQLCRASSSSNALCGGCRRDGQFRSA